MAEKLTSIELDSIHLHDTAPRSLAKQDCFFSQVRNPFILFCSFGKISENQKQFQA